MTKANIILAILIPPYAAYLYYSLAKKVKACADDANVECKDYSILCAIFGFLFLSFVPLAILQSKLNKIYEA